MSNLIHVRQLDDSTWEYQWKKYPSDITWHKLTASKGIDIIKVRHRFNADDDVRDVTERAPTNKQILVVIGGVTFTSLPIGETEAQHVMDSFTRSAPNCDPMIVDAHPVTTLPRLPPGDYTARVLDVVDYKVRIDPASVKPLKPTCNDLDALPAWLLRKMVECLCANNIRMSETEARLELRTMSAESLMDLYLTWEGMSGYTRSIVEALDAIREATSGR